MEAVEKYEGLAGDLSIRKAGDEAAAGRCGSICGDDRATIYKPRIPQHICGDTVNRQGLTPPVRLLGNRQFYMQSREKMEYTTSAPPRRDSEYEFNTFQPYRTTTKCLSQKTVKGESSQPQNVLGLSKHVIGELLGVKSRFPSNCPRGYEGV